MSSSANLWQSECDDKEKTESILPPPYEHFNDQRSINKNYKFVNNSKINDKCSSQRNNYNTSQQPKKENAFYCHNNRTYRDRWCQHEQFHNQDKYQRNNRQQLFMEYNRNNNFNKDNNNNHIDNNKRNECYNNNNHLIIKRDDVYNQNDASERHTSTVSTKVNPSHQHQKEEHEEDFDFEVVRGADGKLYRRSAQAFFVNEHGEFLAFTPLGNPHFLQTVQGGVCKGENPLDAAIRETWEETGLEADRDAALVSVILPTTSTQALLSKEEITTANTKGQSAMSEKHNDANSYSNKNNNNDDDNDDNNNRYCASSAVCEPQSDETTCKRNANNEIVDETRKEFRYYNKTWRKFGVKGQELYPFLFITKREIIHHVRLKPREKGLKQEFARVFWVPLEDILLHTPPTKLNALRNICRAVYFLLRSTFASTISVRRPSIRNYFCSMRAVTSHTRWVIFTDDTEKEELATTAASKHTEHEQQQFHQKRYM